MGKRLMMPVLAGMLIASSAALASSQWKSGTRPAAPTASNVCNSFSGISRTFTAVAGATNGIPGTPLVGETYVVSVSGPGSGSFRIVGDSGGVITYAGPASVPASLSFTVTVPPSPTAEGVGFYFDSGSGSVTLVASCTAAATAAPAIGMWGMAALCALLALVGAGFVATKRIRPES